jgi:tetratricopeptide (TPR) repeat protein
MNNSRDTQPLNRFSPTRKRVAAGTLLLLVMVLLAYAPIFRAGFIWDDDDWLYENPLVTSPSGLSQIWLTPRANIQYYPLMFSTFWLEYRLWGAHATGYHAVNLLLHALAAALLWRLLVRLRIPGAFVAAAVFLLHPLNVESVAWITERKNVLSGMFYLLSMYCFIRYRPMAKDQPALRNDERWYFAALVCFICALFSKTATATLPGALLLILWWKTGRLSRRDIKDWVPFAGAAIWLAAVTVWMERVSCGAEGSLWDWSLAQRIIIAGRAAWFYAAKLAWPTDLSFIYPQWTIPVLSWQWLYPLGAVAIPVVFFLLIRRWGRGPLVAVLYYAGTLLPALGFVNLYFMQYSFVADHWQYLAGIGLITLVVAAVAYGLGRPKRRGFLAGQYALAVGLLLALGTLTFQRVRVYHDEETLWLDTLEQNPGCWMAANNLGTLYLERGRFQWALQWYERAMRLTPQRAEPMYNQALVFEKINQPEWARSMYQKALQADPTYLKAHHNLGLLDLREKRYSDAVEHFEYILVDHPRHAESHNHLGIALSMLGDRDKALQHFGEAVRLKPGYHAARQNLQRAHRPSALNPVENR